VKTKNLLGADNYLYNLDVIQDIQIQVDKKIARQVNKFRASKKNDLSLCDNQEDIWRLSVYKDILNQITFCNSCFKDYKIQDIINSVKSELA